jgi:hypothetical protein
MAENVRRSGKSCRFWRVLFRSGLPENAYHETAGSSAAAEEMPSGNLPWEEASACPEHPFRRLDVLIIDEIARLSAAPVSTRTLVGRYHSLRLGAVEHHRVAALEITEYPRQRPAWDPGSRPEGVRQIDFETTTQMR